MTRVKQPAIQFRSEIAKQEGMQPNGQRHEFTFEFDGTETAKTLPPGWKPYAVYLDGLRQFKGENNDFEIKSDGSRWSVVWAIAPANNSACHIDAERDT